MTATLPPTRREALRALAAQLSEPLTEVDGPPELEDLPRYRLASADRHEALRRALAMVRSGGRVLWVANTVSRAVELAASLPSDVPVAVYHSRFRYCDRLERHSTVVRAFQAREQTERLLAVTTQVCEVSLDISADLLVTEVAPPAALIQRLGRLNRWATPETFDGPRDALVIAPENHRPYTPADIEQGGRWLDALAGRVVSQRDLAGAFADVLAGQPAPARGRSAWLDEPLKLLPATLREIEHTITVVRAEDRAHCFRNGRLVASEVTRYAVPMPYLSRLPVLTWEELGLARVAPPGSITLTEWGAQWT